MAKYPKRPPLDPDTKVRLTFRRVMDRHPAPPWDSLEDFIADAGLPDEAAPILNRIDLTLPIGKGNVAWGKPRGKIGQLTPEQVLRIRYDKSMLQMHMAEMFGVSQGLISAIQRGVAYPKVKRPAGMALVYDAEGRGVPRWVPEAEAPSVQNAAFKALIASNPNAKPPIDEAAEQRRRRAEHGFDPDDTSITIGDDGMAYGDAPDDLA